MLMVMTFVITQVTDLTLGRLIGSTGAVIVGLLLSITIGYARTRGRLQRPTSGTQLAKATPSPYALSQAQRVTPPPRAIQTCPSCGASLPQGAGLCRSCGKIVDLRRPSQRLATGPEAVQAGTVFCTECGAALTLGQRFCEKCGAQA